MENEHGDGKEQPAYNPMAWRAGNQKLTVHKLKTCGNSSHCIEVVEAQLARSTVDSQRYIFASEALLFS